MLVHNRVGILLRFQEHVYVVSTPEISSVALLGRPLAVCGQ